MAEQYDHRWCEKCEKEAWILVKVRVHVGFVRGCENAISEWQTQDWCLLCIQQPIVAGD